ncbi:MAG: FUSC family protein [Solirubrobacteraceae bacterium]
MGIDQRKTGAAGPIAAARAWFGTHDPGHAALRRAGRAAVIMPALFALGDKVIGNPIVATFAAFGSFAMLLLVDFPGSLRDRVRDQAALVLACGAFVALGTVASQHTWSAAVAMAVVAFAVLFAGVVSSVIAGATTSLLLSFILPVSLPGPASEIPDRLAGWGLAGGVSLLAITLLWPAPARNPVRAAAIDACRALAACLRAEIDFVGGGDDEPYRGAVGKADSAISRLQNAFFATPYRPSGLTTDARAVIRLVDELRWLSSIVEHAAPSQRPARPRREVMSVKGAVADVLERAGELLDAPGLAGDALDDTVATMHGKLEVLEQATVAALPGERQRAPASIVSSLDPSFRAQELSFVAAQIASNSALAAAAARRPWLDRVLGRQPAGFAGPVSAAGERASSFATREALWLRNSLRGAAALGVAVLIADLTSVQHGFWVVFGTLSVLRSNALSTGQNIVRALAGTTAGFVVGGAIVYAIGTNTDLLWALLPVAVLCAGLAPAAISFAAGQAAFTLTLLILFNLIAPAGWRIGLVRIEDVAIGCAVSLTIGLLFWPRGAGAALGRALGGAYESSASYLAAAINYGVGCCDPTGPQIAPPRRQAFEAAAASRRLDDTFRGYLGERGAKRVALAEITALVTGVTGVRLAADAVLDLWDGNGAESGDRSAARAELLGVAAGLTDWYRRFAASLAAGAAVPDPLPDDESAGGRLIEAVARDLRDGDGHATAAGVRVLWTGDHLDAARRLQELLVGPARATIGAGV